MAGVVDQSFEAKFLELEAQVRAMRARNPLDDAAVVSPTTGGYVAMSSLAFGQVTASDPALLEILTPAGIGGSGWIAGNPVVDVYVTGGRLRVDVAAALTASGNKLSMFMSYGLIGPTTAPGQAGALIVGPAFDRAVEVQHSHAGQDQRAAAGTFGLHTGLARGWYRVACYYATSYSNTSYPYGSAQNRRLAAAPL